MSLWLNNQYVGYSQDSCLSAEFDITSQLGKLNTHTLSVQVSRWCDGSYIEDQDKWWLSGIYREVYLVRKPRIFISDYEFTVDMKSTSAVTDTGKSNDVNVNIQVLCEGLQGEDCAVKIELFDAKDKSKPPILSQVAAIKPAEATASNPVYVSVNQETSCAAIDPYTSDINQIIPSTATSAGTCRISTIVTNPLLWTAETPHLYVLVLSLHSTLNDAERGSHPIDVEGCRVGIRDIRLHSVSNALCVNDQPITIAGVNRHEFHPKTGRSVDESTMRLDAAILKQLNFNAVRLSHYPNHRRWLEICDEAGLYVIDEANIESHGFQVFGQAVGYLSHQPDWRGAMLSRIARMCERDKNYSCIIGWSLGNESGVGPNHEAGSTFLRARDPRRFVQYESGGACTKVTDIISPMYLRPAWCRDKAQNDPLRRPVILCEYAHAMGNSGGCLAQYWRDFRDPLLPRLQGGFIWDYIDQGLLLPEVDDSRGTNKQGKAPRYGYGGDFGDMPNTKQFCINGVLGPDRIPHPSAFEAAALQSPIQASLGVDSTSSEDTGIDQLYVTITNYRSHTNTSDVIVLLKLTCDANTHSNTRAYNQQHTIVFPSGDNISPGNRKSILIAQLWPSLVSTKSTPIQQLRSLFPGIRDEDVMAIQEVWIDVIIQVKPERGSEWVPGGHVMLHTSLVHSALNECIRGKIALLGHASGIDIPGVTPTYTASETHLQVQWDNGNYANICKATGLLDTWRTSSEEDIITNPISVCLYRAPLDNDMGGDFIAYTKQWETWGIHCLQHKPRHAVTVTVVPLTTECDYIIIEVKYVLYPALEVLAPVDIPVTLRYTFHGSDHSIKVESSVLLPAVLPAIPRVGVRFAVNPSYDEVKWCGLGPYEAYDDRKSCVYIDTFISSVENLHTPYVFPTENGRRADPRWIAATTPSKDSNGIMNGILIIPSDSDAAVSRADSICGYGWSASYYSLEMLNKSTHDFELRADPVNNVYIHVDSHMMGIGGYDSWSPNVDSNRLIQGDDRVPKHTSMRLVPLTNATSERITQVYTSFIKQKYG